MARLKKEEKELGDKLKEKSQAELKKLGTAESEFNREETLE